MSLGPSWRPITPNNNINGTTTSTRLCFNSSYQTKGFWKIRIRVTTSFSSHSLIHFLCFLVLLFLFVKFVGGSNCLYSFFSWFRCEHYKRRCKIRAPCCNQIFPCRHCHNEVTVSFYIFLCVCVCVLVFMCELTCNCIYWKNFHLGIFFLFNILMIFRATWATQKIIMSWSGKMLSKYVCVFNIDMSVYFCKL